MTIPLALGGATEGAYRLVLESAPAAPGGVSVEVLDRGIPAALAPGEALPVSVPVGVGHYALRLRASGGVASEDVPAGAARVGEPYPDPTSGRAAVEVTV